MADNEYNCTFVEFLKYKNCRQLIVVKIAEDLFEDLIFLPFFEIFTPKFGQISLNYSGHKFPYG